MHVSEIETPAIIVDLDIMERNIRRIADYAREHELRLRPHTKTHKSTLLGRMQLDAGAVGLTVAKVGEAEVLVNTGTPDLLIAYPVLGKSKLQRLLQVARKTSVTVAVDSFEVAKGISEAASEAGLEIGLLLEQDEGLGRTGLTSVEGLIELAKSVHGLPGLRLLGFNFYPGHIKSTDAESLQKLDELNERLNETVAQWEAAGLPLEIISGGSTPTLFESHRLAALNEIRPGTYIFNDRNTIVSGACSVEDCAAHVLVTVVSKNRAEGLIIDGGSKTFSSDALSIEGTTTFGLVREAPEAQFVKMNEEHGYVNLPGAHERFQIGDRLRVLPNHICVAVNLHERVYGIRGDVVEKVWDVEARGKLQ